MIHFTINAPPGSLTTSPVGAVPGGFRLQVGYGTKVRFEGLAHDDTPIRGKVVTGSDWVLLRDDGVATFSAKITFEAEFDEDKPPGRHVFDGVLSGRVNIKGLENWTAITQTQQWRKLNGLLTVNLPIQFETSQKPPEGASEDVKTAARYSELFADLARNQFVATGDILVESGEIVRVNLNVVTIADVKAQYERLVIGAEEQKRQLDDYEQRLAAMDPPPGFSAHRQLADPFWSLLLAINDQDTWSLCASIVPNVVPRIEQYLASVSGGSRVPINTAGLRDLYPQCDWQKARSIIQEIDGQIRNNLDLAAG